MIESRLPGARSRRLTAERWRRIWRSEENGDHPRYQGGSRTGQMCQNSARLVNFVIYKLYLDKENRHNLQEQQKLKVLGIKLAKCTDLHEENWKAV